MELTSMYVTQVVTSLRKIVTFTSSFMLFPKPFTALHAVSAACALTGAYALQRLRDTIGDKKRSKRE